MKDLKYNYVFLGAGGYYLAGYNDLMQESSVRYFQDYTPGFRNGLSKALLRYTFSEKVNKVIKTPFSSFVYPRLFPINFTDDKPLCYVFFGNWHYVFNSSYMKYLKKKHPDAKCVLYMQDIVAKHGHIDMDVAKKVFDIIVSYDRGDCQRYGLLYHQTPMSLMIIPENVMIPKSDFYFCGKPKKRYWILADLFEQLTKKGYTCDFNVVGEAIPEDQIPGIHYSHTPMDYFDNLAHVVRTKCIVEIMQDNADGYTPRFWESILYDKHLLTNNSLVKTSRYYSEKSIHILNEIGEDADEWINEPIFYSADVKQSLSPIHLVEFIDKQLCK